MTFLCVGVFTLIASSLLANNGILIRFSPASYDAASRTLHVDIQVKAEDHQINLAGQNYRIFYNSASLSLQKDKSKLLLPGDKYSDLKFLDCQEGIKASGAGKINFDNNLGFINFSIDLSDNKAGGIILSAQKEWKSVATLRFKVTDETAVSSFIWGRDGVSHDYATAFVEMAEWLGPRNISALDIKEYNDLNYQLTTDKTFVTNNLNLSFAPNPAIDVIKLDFGQELSDFASITIKDYIGREVLKCGVSATSKTAFVDISALSAGNYIIEVQSNDLKYSALKNLVKM